MSLGVWGSLETVGPHPSSPRGSSTWYVQIHFTGRTSPLRLKPISKISFFMGLAFAFALAFNGDFVKHEPLHLKEIQAYSY